MKLRHFQKDFLKCKSWFEKNGELNTHVCFESNLTETPHNTWWINSGCMTHVSNIMQRFLTIQTISPNFPQKKQTIPKKKSYWSMITHVIFDLIGNDLQNQVMTYLWFRIRIKHWVQLKIEKNHSKCINLTKVSVSS